MISWFQQKSVICQAQKKSCFPLRSLQRLQSTKSYKNPIERISIQHRAGKTIANSFVPDPARFAGISIKSSSNHWPPFHLFRVCAGFLLSFVRQRKRLAQFPRTFLTQVLFLSFFASSSLIAISSRHNDLLCRFHAFNQNSNRNDPTLSRLFQDCLDKRTGRSARSLIDQAHPPFSAGHAGSKSSGVALPAECATL